MNNNLSVGAPFSSNEYINIDTVTQVSFLNPTNKFSVQDSVAVLNDKYSNDVTQGQVGTIVQILNNDLYTVDFCDKDGITLVTCYIAEEDLLKLHTTYAGTKSRFTFND